MDNIFLMSVPLDTQRVGCSIEEQDDCILLRCGGGGFRFRADAETAWGLDAVMALGADLRRDDIRYSDSKRFGTIHPVTIKWLGDGLVLPTPDSGAILMQGGHAAVLAPEHIGALVLAVSIKAGSEASMWSSAETMKLNRVRSENRTVTIWCNSPDGEEGPPVTVRCGIDIEPGITEFLDHRERTIFEFLHHHDPDNPRGPRGSARFGRVGDPPALSWPVRAPGNFSFHGTEYPWWARYMLINRKIDENLKDANATALLSQMAAGALAYAVRRPGDFDWHPKRPEVLNRNGRRYPPEIFENAKSEMDGNSGKEE